MAPPDNDANAATRARIMAHMNKDHGAELSRYLRHYAGVPARRAENAAMTSLSLESMTIRAADGKEHVVPFVPPMGSYADARRRAVEMDAAAREGLGLGDVEVTEYRRPRGLGLFVFCSVLGYLGCYAALPWQVPGSALHSFWDAVFPGGARTQEWLVRTIFLPVVGIHLFEVLLMERTRLAKFGVRRGSGLWWAWLADCLIEGFPVFQRFDGLVRSLRKAKGKAE